MKNEANKLEVYIIRHGTTDKAMGNQLVSAVRDFPLNAEGIKQTEALRKRFSREGYHFDRIYSSPIRVAQETAGRIFGERGYVIEPRLTKVNHGDWEYKKKDDVYTEEVRRALEADPYNWHAPNGESQASIEERMYSFLEEIRKGMRIGKVAAISHGIPTISLLRKCLGVNSKDIQNMELANTSLTRIDYDSGGWKVVKVNDNEHLLN